jgi:hypothetical protein
MPDFGIFRGFNEKLFGDKLYAGQLPINLGLIGSQEVIDFLLLDLYPSAAAAYSLRKLRVAYTGSAIEVRRTNLDVADIGFTSTGELDTAALLAFTGTGALDNGFVTKWYDQSGNARDATQSNAINQPQIVSGGSVLIDLSGLPTMRMDGINDNLRTVDFVNIPTPFTIFMVNKWISVSSFPYLVDFEVNAAIGYISGVGLKNEAFFGATLKSSLSIELTTPLLWYVLSNNASSELSLNNETIITGNLGTRLPRRVVIGSQNANIAHANSFYSELILYPSNQSLNRIGLTNNINDFYSIY